MIDLERQTELRASIELFYFAYRAFTARPDHILDRRGLGRVHHRILYFVGRNPDIVVNDLLRILAVSKQALNAPLRQLVEMKLVTMRPATRDRRYKQLSLTGEGVRLESQLTGTQVKHLATVFAAAGTGAENAWQKVMWAMPEKG